MKFKRKKKLIPVPLPPNEFIPGFTNSQYCAVNGCNNNRNKYPPISLFRFPTDPERCRTWVINAKREDLLDKDAGFLYATSRMCSTHFEDCMFANVYKSRLLPCAIPTIFDLNDQQSDDDTDVKIEEDSSFNSLGEKDIAKGSKMKLLECSNLELECEKEGLSKAQLSHNKSKINDFQILQAAFQAFSSSFQNNEQPLSNGLPQVNLLNVTPSATPNSVPNAPPQTNGSTFPPSSFLQYVFNNRNSLSVSTPSPPSTDKSKRKKGGGSIIKVASPTTVLNQNGLSALNKQSAPSPSVQITPKVPKPPPAPKPTLTQSLRATRKTTGSLPPPRIDLATIDIEPEIEVLQDSRTTKVSNAFTPAILSKPKPAPAPAPVKPLNNVMLLNVSVRPRNIAPVTINSTQRKELDGRVKNVLMKSPSEFVEWLLQQGLIRPQQYCNIHKGSNRAPTKLKLGVFSDPKVLTSSGGYVWIGECCGRKYVSVYSGSIFGSTPIDRVSPTSLLKLVYHWSCQTSISNVETWVKVEKLFVSKIYHYLRCICSVILHDKVYDFGFEFSKVELGIVSLGTTTADGSRKAVKVEILGLYDRKMKSYRLFASTPEPGNTSKERFMRILKPILQVVHRNAVIVCDQSVDPACLHSMSYSKVEICTTSDDESDGNSNSTVMFYLRKHVPKMFQAALSQLSENQVQLILDELCWREKFAATALRCYENIIDNIFYITSRELENPGVLPLLEYVSDNPHNNWRYKSQQVPKVIPTVPASIILPPSNGPLNVIPTQYTDPAPNPVLHPNKVMTRNLIDGSSSPRLGFSNSSNNGFQLGVTPTSTISMTSLDITQKVPGEYKDLEPYFYARLMGNPEMGKETNSLIFFCHICNDTYSENISFYSHMKLHHEKKPFDREKVDFVCPYCMLSFDNINSLNKHKIDDHLMSDLTQIWCRICSERFANEHLLKTHMMRKHVEAEMPYRCDVCHFSTSFYYEVINHFNKVHKGSKYIQCHICLNVMTINQENAAGFSAGLMSHLERHSLKNPCRSCLLDFDNRVSLELHKKAHTSCTSAVGLTRYESPKGYRALQFKPVIGPVRVYPTPTPTTPTTTPTTPPVLLTVEKTLPPVALTTTVSRSTPPISTIIEDQSDLKFDIGDDKYYCLECDAPISIETPHLRRYRKCTRCPYSSSCQSTILKHSQIFHPHGSSRPMPYVLGHPVHLPDPMFCPCGFSTKSGHHLARHLAHCEQKTAYPVSHNTNTTESLGYSSPMNETPMEVDDEYDAPLQMLPLAVELEEG